MVNYLTILIGIYPNRTVRHSMDVNMLFNAVNVKMIMLLHLQKVYTKTVRYGTGLVPIQ